jgi:hypothetical protein
MSVVRLLSLHIDDFFLTLLLFFTFILDMMLQSHLDVHRQDEGSEGRGGS